MKTFRSSVEFLSVLLLIEAGAFSDETDQYLVWGVELRDSAESVNRYLNTQTQAFLQNANGADEECGCEELVHELYDHLFDSRLNSRLKRWINNANEVDLFPDRSVSTTQYRNMSIMRGPAFPFIVPMARTMRIGDVYFGMDKLSHMFSYGGRYYNRYQKHRRKGLSEEEALEKIVHWGIRQEISFVGKLVDGVFSHADLEANYQGFLLARDFCDDENPYFVKQGGKWRLDRPIDLRPYITPHLDESFETSHYRVMRKRFVFSVMKSEYIPMMSLPEVQARFELYRKTKPSFSVQVVHKYFEETRRNPQKEQARELLGNPEESR